MAWAEKLISRIRMIIMTSNIGVRQLKDFGEGVGFATASRMQNADENNKAVIEKALKRTFSPEFLNRIDDVVIFNSLTKEHIFKIIDILMKRCDETFDQSWIQHGVDRRCKSILLQKKDMMRNLVQDHCTGQFKNILKIRWQKKYLTMNVKQGDILIADLDKENQKIKFTLKQGKEGKEEKSKA